MLLKDPWSLKHYSLWMCCSEIVAESALVWGEGSCPKSMILGGTCRDHWRPEDIKKGTQPGWDLSDSVMTPREAAKYLLVTVGELPLPTPLSLDVPGWGDGTFHVFWTQDDTDAGRQNWQTWIELAQWVWQRHEKHIKTIQRTLKNAIIRKHKSPYLNMSKRFEQTPHQKR